MTRDGSVLAALLGAARTRLCEDEADVWYAAPEALVARGDDLESAWGALLDPEERSRWAQFRSPAARRQFAAGRVLARTSLSRYAEPPPAAWRFSLGPFGRPEVSAPRLAAPLYFNVSHVGGLVACIVGRVPLVGVDVESLDRPIDVEVVGRHALDATERADLASLPAVGRRPRVLAAWTVKEAVLKATGLGLRRPPESIGVCFEGGDRVAVDVGARWGVSPRFTVRLVRAGGTHFLAAAVGRARAQIRLAEASEAAAR